MDGFDDDYNEGEMRSREPSKSEYELKSTILENDERVGGAFKTVQAKDKDGRPIEYAIFNGNKEYITRGLKLGNLKEYTASHQWALVRLKLIRYLMFIDEEENIDLSELTSFFIDGLYANFNMSLSLDRKGFDALTKTTRSQEYKEKRVAESTARGGLRSNPLRDNIE